jgi:hypothetical protein
MPKGKTMKLFKDGQLRRLLENGKANVARIAKDGNTFDFRPVVKLFCPWGGATWLLTEIDPENPNIAFGLCDFGIGSPEIGSVSLAELSSVRGPGGHGIERDMYFKADRSLETYAEEARRTGQISA